MLTACGVVALLAVLLLGKILVVPLVKDLVTDFTFGNVMAALACIAICASTTVFALEAFGARMPWWAATPVTALFAVAGAVGLFIAGWKRYWTGTADALFRISWKLKSWRLFGMGIEETLMLLGPLAMLACVVHSVFFVQRPDYPQWLLSLLKVPK